MTCFPGLLDPSLESIQTAIRDNPSGGWEAAWERKITPWDFGGPQPALEELVENADAAPNPQWNIPKSGRALVPGCGRGYDTLYFATRGLQVTGVDISQTAVDQANIWLQQQKMDDVASRVEFKLQDFFNYSVEDGFDLAYDYTFFCAIPPKLRKSWADKYAELIKPGGIFITLIYPIDGDRPAGPPYSVDPELYLHHLSEHFTQLQITKPTTSPPKHQMKELIAVWRRK